jgi:hypothetical protein
LTGAITEKGVMVAWETLLLNHFAELSTLDLQSDDLSNHLFHGYYNYNCSKKEILFRKSTMVTAFAISLAK